MFAKELFKFNINFFFFFYLLFLYRTWEIITLYNFLPLAMFVYLLSFPRLVAPFICTRLLRYTLFPSVLWVSIFLILLSLFWVLEMSLSDSIYVSSNFRLVFASIFISVALPIVSLPPLVKSVNRAKRIKLEVLGSEQSFKWI